MPFLLLPQLSLIVIYHLPQLLCVRRLYLFDPFLVLLSYLVCIFRKSVLFVFKPLSEFLNLSFQVVDLVLHLLFQKFAFICSGTFKFFDHALILLSLVSHLRVLLQLHLALHVFEILLELLPLFLDLEP